MLSILIRELFNSSKFSLLEIKNIKILKIITNKTGNNMTSVIFL